MKPLNLSFALILTGLASLLSAVKSKVWQKRQNIRGNVNNTSPDHNSPTNQQDKNSDDEQGEIYLHQSMPTHRYTTEEEWYTEQRRNWRRQLWPQWTLAATAVIASAIGIGTLIIVKGTLDATKDTADAAKAQAAAAQTATEIAKRTFDENVNTFQLDQRAWVGMKSLSFRGQVKLGSELYAVIQIENTGKTPALEVTVNKALSFKSPTKETFAQLPKVGAFANFVIAPNGTFATVQMLSNNWTEDDIKRLNKDTAYIFGRIFYRDVFGHGRQTWFCGFYRRDFFPALSFCETLNYMD